ncbi:double-strand break repair helicase AddA [Rubellimicrobium sp. CFH 75288]|uniref:double-strand break repair helicase AddA n=1 Tax=Rubellimicrobium sp. CFH 75288 TaxID=2697034 RepID=UPI0014127693|nr:double-strand break repair helicase AddA [Rubellimicrobium sp. CFH 75288]NAZ37786.1 double-strand break repair helicase AddA [Rubellimicrobium sp. CFH 75288]
MNAPRPGFPSAAPLPHPAARRQHEAADPHRSTWLSANAGSGKTRVLTDRVARLLLAGTDPANILCLTFTKAAAAEMQTRLFRRLGGWALRAEDALLADLRDLGLTEGLEPLDLPQARRLFAQALETPGGLKIQTIHAFCASLLRRFPFEAGVPPTFRELGDQEAARLRQDAAEAMAADGQEAPLLDRVARHMPPSAFDALLAAIIERRQAFLPARGEAALAALLGLGPDDSEAALLGCIETVERRQLLRDLAALCAEGGAKDQAAAQVLRSVCAHDPFTPDSLAALEGVLLFKSGKTPFAPRTDFPTKALRDRAPALMKRLEALMRDVAARRELRLCLAAHARNRDLHAFARAFLARYDALKRARGALDFDDLITRAHALLSDPSVSAWVLWRLDGGLDHILVDEAQDTSPAQWAVIERLAEEMSAGAGARPDRPRTLFVVGDRKQSIFSFQGADAEGFDRWQRRFGDSLARAGRALFACELEHSFRSAPPILEAVDATFGADHDGLGSAAPQHRAFRDTMPGRVDLWPAIPKAEVPPEDEDWIGPGHGTEPPHPHLELARRVAAAVERMIAEEWLPVEREGRWHRRRIRPGDVMILVQRRDTLFAALNRELKRRGLAVAGADRIALRGELAVRDVEAVLRVLSLPQDDLSLAAALRSPLFGWSEDDLFRLAHGRPANCSLWEALDAAGESEARTILRDLRAQTDFLRPYELAQRLLLRHGGRLRLLARLGPEAEDALDAFLAQAMAYEAQSVPSLTGFLEWRACDEAEVKRQMDAAGDRIRVMTVHGAKGLEAPVVVLPDCASREIRGPGPLFTLGEGDAVWPPTVDAMPRCLRERRDALMAAERRERRRLLYVAMTRAESWLVVCAAGECGPDSWHAEVRRGLLALGSAECDFGHPEGKGLRHGLDDWAALPALEEEGAAPEPGPEGPADPGPLAPPPPRREPRSPSDLGGPKTLPDEEGDGTARGAALARGRLIHLALEHLPRASPDAVLRLMEATEEAALAGDLPDLLAEAQALIAAPDLARLWGCEALAEVALAADLPGLGRLEGQVDCLLPDGEGLLVVDFKTNRLVPERAGDVPEGLLRQVAAYRAMAAAACPGRPVEGAILWTRTARLMRLPPGLLEAALARAAAAWGPAP